MSMQVCEHPGCKAITLMKLCEDHRYEDFDDDESNSASEIRAVTDEEIVDLVKHMAVLVKDEQKEVPMASTSEYRRCTALTNKGTRCTTGSKRGMNVCVRHFEKPSPKPSISAAPVPRSSGSGRIVLADPIMLNQANEHEVNHQANGHLGLPSLYEAIADLEQDLAALMRAKAILERRA